MVAAGLLSSAHAAEQAFTPLPQEDPQAMQARYLDWNAGRAGWSRSASGLEYRRVEGAETSAVHPAADSVVTVDCAGHFIDGRLFFATKPGDPLVGPLPKLIKGWQEGVQMMHVGETWEFVLPSDLAYGARGWTSKSDSIPSIPPDTALLFTIKLEAVEAPPQSQDQRKSP